MNKILLRTIGICVIALGVLVILWMAFKMNPSQPKEQELNALDNPSATATLHASGTDAGTGQIQVALLDYTATKAGKSRGCDHVILKPYTVEKTSTPLNAALKQLFAIKETDIADLNNFIPKTAATLSFDNAQLENGIAKIYLKGSLSGLAGVCDDPRAKIQIEETALQFASVKSVEIYLNGKKTALQPSEK